MHRTDLIIKPLNYFLSAALLLFLKETGNSPEYEFFLKTELARFNVKQARWVMSETAKQESSPHEEVLIKDSSFTSKSQ